MEADVTQSTAGLTPEHATPQPGWRRVSLWVAEHELWYLVLVVAVLIFPELVPDPIVITALLLIPVPWLCRWIATGRLTRRTPFDFPIFTLLLMIPASLYATTDLNMSLVTVYQIVAGIALFYGIVNALSSQQAVRTTAAFLSVWGVGLALLAPFTTRWISEKVFTLPGFFQRFPLLIGDPITRNVLAGLLLVLIPIPLSLLLFGARNERAGHRVATRIVETKPLLALGVISMLLMLIFTQSRGAYVALVTSVLILGIARSRWVWLAVPVAILGVVIGLRTFGIEAIGDPLLVQDAAYGIQARQEVWQRAIYMLQDFPYTGIGLRTFPRVANALYPFFLAGSDVEILHAHNLFLQVGVDLGLPGLVAFMALFSGGTALAWSAFRRFDRDAQPNLKALAIALLGSFAALAVHGLVDSVIWGSKMAPMFWLLLGLSAALYHLSLSSSNSVEQAA